MAIAPRILNPFYLLPQVAMMYLSCLIDPGVRADPPLASHGITQTRQLTEHLLSLPQRPQKIYCSPYYRCIQTIVPLSKALNQPIYLDEGIGEWYGLLRQSASPDHPTPLSVDQWSPFFPDVEFRQGDTGIIGNRRGETLTQVHERAKKAL